MPGGTGHGELEGHRGVLLVDNGAQLGELVGPERVRDRRGITREDGGDPIEHDAAGHGGGEAGGVEVDDVQAA